MLNFPKIEEALKLYQNALKLHSQGPAFYDEAGKAYEEIFRSEIFTYTEALSENQLLEKFGATDLPDDIIEDDLTAELPALTTGGEGAPSTLPQILYLAYKNFGQFRLDSLSEQLNTLEDGLRSEYAEAPSKGVSTTAAAGLKNLAEALDRDEGDLELWRKVARVAEFLGSRRLARFCLETVLDTGGVDPATEIEPLTIEEILANEQIGPLLTSIDKEMARAIPQFLPGRSQTLIKPLRKHVDPCPYLPKVVSKPLSQSLPSSAKEQEIEVPLRTWASCGKAILFRQNQEEQGMVVSEAGARFIINIPPPYSNGSASRMVGSNVDNSGSNAANIATKSARSLPSKDSSGGVSPAEIGKKTSQSPKKTDQSVAESAVISPVSATTDKEEAQLLPESTNAASERQQSVLQEDGAKAPTMVLPTRKRSSETAELQDGPEPGRARSKRIRARGSLMDPNSIKDSIPEDWSKWYKQQLEIYVQADSAAYSSARELLSGLKIEVSEIGDDSTIAANQGDKEQDLMAPKAASQRTNVAYEDLCSLLDPWDPSKSKMFLYGDSPRNIDSHTSAFSSTSFTSFLAQPAAAPPAIAQHDSFPDAIGLDDFVKQVNEKEWDTLSQVAYRWVQSLLQPESLHLEEHESLYERSAWPDGLKETMVRILVGQDEYIYEATKDKISVLGGPVTATEDRNSKQSEYSLMSKALASFVEAVFELHLDIYGRITNPSSEVDAPTRTLQCDRLSRWSLLANSVVSSSVVRDSPKAWAKRLRNRFLWASVVCHNLLNPSMLTTSVSYFQEIIREFREDTRESDEISSLILLPNNAVMSEISIGAAEREISRLTTLDFFDSIFNTSDNSPMLVVETLEPLLALSVRDDSACEMTSNASHQQENGQTDSLPLEQRPLATQTDPRLIEALHFLNRSSISLKLFLWQRLQDAYSVINFPPEILSCNIWCLTIIVKHLTSESHASGPVTARQESLLRWLHKLDELMTQILALVSTDNSAFESIDFFQTCAALEAIASLQRILHAFARWEDSIRVGQTQPTPQPSSSSTKAQLRSAEKFREMIVKTWTLQYIFIKEAYDQESNTSLHLKGDLVNYLRLAHEALGLRTYCGLASKSFLKLLKVELLHMAELDESQEELPQVISDLYGIKITSSSIEIQDHSCESTDIDKSTALDILNLVMVHVNRISIKDLLKSDLKYTIDKMQQVIRIPKASSASARSFNKKLINAYIKSSINPVELYRSLRGIGELNSTPAKTEGWAIAAKGWYFLVGHLYLVKFRSQKRVAPGSLDDLENAKIMFKADLEFDTEKWETWYRLAQVYDTQVDESVTWSADKLQNDPKNLIEVQRKAILCYAMATAVAKRSKAPSFDSAAKIACLYADFGLRIYASSREPFSMKAFELNDFKRQFNGQLRGMYEDLPFKPLSLYGAWKLSKALLVQASRQKPEDWR